MALFYVITILTGLNSVLATMNLESCESGAKLHDTDLETFTFQDGVQQEPRFYRYLKVDSQSGSLYVGSMNHVYSLGLTDISDKLKIKKQDLSPKSKDVRRCYIQGKNEMPDCQSHVKFIATNISAPNTLFVCATGAYHPKSYQINIQYNRLSIQSESSGIGMCPYDPFDNATAVLVESDNPGNVPALYSGTVTDFIKADPVIFRPALYHRNRTQSAAYVRTLRNDHKWLNEPQFVGSFDVGSQVYFFLREVALEYQNCGKKIYSRIARVCKNDRGGKAVLNSVWTSYQKARLNCSIPGEYPYYFDEIQDVYTVDGQTFYGLFTTNINGLTASAICAFSVQDIENAFNGPFKDQSHSKANWLPVPESDVPYPRPGNCSIEDSRSLPDTVVNFVKDRPLMDKAVAQQFGRPLFYKGNCLMQRLAVEANVSGNGELVFYTASNTGLVYKIFARPSKSVLEAPRSILSTTYKPFDNPRPIWSMVLHDKYVYLGTDSSVVQLNVMTCEKYKKIDLCVFDPYCGWSKAAGECIPIQDKNTNNLITYKDIDMVIPLENAVENALNEPLFETKELRRSAGHSLSLKVDFKLHISGTVIWTKNDSKLSSPRHIIAQDNSLIIPELMQSDQGTYKAIDDQDRLVAEYSVMVDTSKEDIEQRWIQKFDEWCQEFERYQNDIRTWEKKCSNCCEDPSNAISSFGGK
ncbi:hypothetical protein SNE40_005016 [Patella caerulea]|uniref:Semaphorin-2A n=1 Tax=Patella caerulea TaxID=87958 RepID=A0AAN8K5W3_PATCE